MCVHPLDPRLIRPNSTNVQQTVANRFSQIYGWRGNFLMCWCLQEITYCGCLPLVSGTTADRRISFDLHSRSTAQSSRANAGWSFTGKENLYMVCKRSRGPIFIFNISPSRIEFAASLGTWKLLSLYLTLLRSETAGCLIPCWNVQSLCCGKATPNSNSKEPPWSELELRPSVSLSSSSLELCHCAFLKVPLHWRRKKF